MFLRDVNNTLLKSVHYYMSKKCCVLKVGIPIIKKIQKE